MNSSSPYSPLLDRIRTPQSSLQRFAVVSLFENLRSAPQTLAPISNHARQAISHCLTSDSSPVVDQSIRELCRLVIDGTIDPSLGLFELQSALEGCDPELVDIFVKGIGLIVRKSPRVLKEYVESNPFVRVLSTRVEVERELVEQVLLLVVESRKLGALVQVCDFLRPFLSFVVLRMCSKGSSCSFAKRLVSSMGSLSCSLTSDGLTILKLLMQCLKYLPCKNQDDFEDIRYFSEIMVDAYVVVLRGIVSRGMHRTLEDGDDDHDAKEGKIEDVLTSRREVKNTRITKIEAIGFGGVACTNMATTTLAMTLVAVSVVLRYPTAQAQLFGVELLESLLSFHTNFGRHEHPVGRSKIGLFEEFLLILPVINLLSSPSKSVKGVASDLLSLLENHLVDLLVANKEIQIIQEDPLSLGKLENIIWRLMQHLWFQDLPLASFSFFLSFAPKGDDKTSEEDIKIKSWFSQIREYCLMMGKRQKSELITRSNENHRTEISLLLSSVVAILVVHQSLGSCAVDTLAAVSIMDPEVGLTLLLTVLFYCRILCNKESYRAILLKLLEMLPTLASYPAMVPLVVQTIMSMLNNDAKPVLHATAVRLLCKTWQVTDRVFKNLQLILHPKAFDAFKYDKNTCISLAASVCDICRKDPDRGVDLILSVSACVESRQLAVLALGLHSLSHLCEADLVDFYTAWDVIAKDVLVYSTSPIVAQGICALLKWGAMDAEAYFEESKTVVRILWDVGTSRHASDAITWTKARVSAFESLKQYEVLYIQQSIPDFKKDIVDLLLSEDDPDVLRAVEEFGVKIITLEHVNRRRWMKEKRVTVNKIEKLLDVFSYKTISSGKGSSSITRVFPGAALLGHSFTPKEGDGHKKSKELRKLHSAYENAMVEIAESLQLSRNILLAQLSLQSWKPFVQHWLRASVAVLDKTVPSDVANKTSQAANSILEIMVRIADESIPRWAENIALSIGALCMVLPASAHSVTTTAAKFLLDWLHQFEREHRQWSVAIALGLVMRHLHATDRRLKFQILSALLTPLCEASSSQQFLCKCDIVEESVNNVCGILANDFFSFMATVLSQWVSEDCLSAFDFKVACGSRSTLVKGACGASLGLACEGLISIEGTDLFESANGRTEENNLLGRIVRALCLAICQLSPSSSGSLESICKYFPSDTDDIFLDATSDLCFNGGSNLENDVWGVVGLVLGLANSVNAIYMTGGSDSVIILKALLMSWIPYVNALAHHPTVCHEKSGTLCSVGACLALPIVVAFCSRIELVDDDELNHLVNGYRELISDLLSVKKTGIYHQSLSMAACAGAGNLLSFILDEGVNSLKAENIKCLLELFRKTYSNPNVPIVYFGGMLGVVNALGARAGIFIHTKSRPSLVQINYEQKVSAYIRGPILSSPACEAILTPMVQEMILVARDPKDPPLQNYAAWAVSFLKYQWRSEEIVKSNEVSSTLISQTFPEDSLVWQLCVWLMNLNSPEAKMVYNIATVLRCLSRAPRLPSSEWGAIVRRCMRFEHQNSGKGVVREECIKFALIHANHINPLLLFLDELYEFSRFRTLELSIQKLLLSHLGDLIKIFSTSRLVKLCDDMIEHFSSPGSLYHMYNNDQKGLLRLSFWKGLRHCLESLGGASSEFSEYMESIEKCMVLLFSFLPAYHFDSSLKMDQANLTDEWSAAVECIGKARRDWILDFLEVPKIAHDQGESSIIDDMKKIQARARLVISDCIPFTELTKLKSSVLNAKSSEIWDALVDVVAALRHAENSLKIQWLADAMEISCISKYPCTVMQFVGLLCGSCCDYMPLLKLDQLSVLRDLPVSLPSLLSNSRWTCIAESVALNLWQATERLYNWIGCTATGADASTSQSIDISEASMASLLLRAMHQTCFHLKEYLPLKKQLKLASITLT
ncbi:hypothetical protein Sjap_023526 [Stephania japonica]|uniref:DUF3730 domain-containing protein n=1 Tax=Stephania japonica TaxID=461633 RepID=A0AAP0EBT8_9MAGN